MSDIFSRTPGPDTVTSSEIVDGAIVNADINSSAAIVGSKIVDASDTAKGVATFDENDFLVSSGDATIAVRVRNRASVLGGYVENLGLTLSSGTFTVTGADGTALGATNPAWVVLQDDASPGHLTAYEVTADQNFIDDAGASEIINNLFGATTGVAWANDVPFYLYAVTNNAKDAIAFMISRVPHATQSPAAANIGAPDDAVADIESDFFSLDNIDETLFDTNPCLCIGSFRMQMTSSDDWTVQALNHGDGIGKYQEGKTFVMPLNQNGASSGTFMRPNAGTAPVFTTNDYIYSISRDGNVDCYFELSADGGTDGASTVVAQLSVPLEVDTQFPGEAGGFILLLSATTFSAGIGALVSPEADTQYATLKSTTFAAINNDHFTNGDRAIKGSCRYKAKVNQ